MLGFRSLDLTAALYIVAVLALYMLLTPAREGMKGKKGKKGEKGKKMMQLKKGGGGLKNPVSFPRIKKKNDDDENDTGDRQKYDTVQQLAAAVKAFVEPRATAGLKVVIQGTDKKKQGRIIHVKIQGSQGVKFHGQTRVESGDALKAGRGLLAKMFASAPLSRWVDVADKSFKKGTTNFDTVAALTQRATTAVATAKSQGYTVVNIMANKKWDGADDFVHMSVYGRKPGEKSPTFFFRGYSRLDTDATLMATYQTLQQTIAGMQEPKKFRAFLIGNRVPVVPVATTAPAITAPAITVTAGTVVPTLAPTAAPVATIPPTVSMPPMSSADPLATLPPLVTSVAM